MKENICTDCGARKCNFRGYNRETCPRGLRPPQLLLKHFHIKEPAIDFDVSKITRRLMAEVTDTTDAVIVEAIRKEAERQGFTDLYLIDRELVKKVIEAATARRGAKTDGEGTESCTECAHFLGCECFSGMTCDQFVRKEERKQ